MILQMFLALGGARRKSPVFDETAFLAGGYAAWTARDYRLIPESGILPQRWAALPLLLGRWRFPSLDQAAWRTSDAWQLGHEFFYGAGNDADGMLFRARAMTALLGAGLGLIVYLWSRRLFGPRGGIISLALYAFCPALLAHSGLATADLAAALFFACAAWSLWTALHRLSPGTLSASLLATSALFLSKMSAVLVVPMGLIFVCIRLVSGPPLTLAFGRPRQIGEREEQLLIYAIVGLAHAAAVFFAVWASYGFRYSAFHGASEGARMYYGGWEDILAGSGAAGALVDFARRWRLLPEAYLYGFSVIVRTSLFRPAFLNGHYSATGWWYYFPYCFLVKTPLSFFPLFLLGPVIGLKDRRTWKGVLYSTTPLWVLLAVYWIFALQSRVDIGDRYILPVYPAFLVLCGAAGRWFETAHRPVRLAVMVLVAAFALESLRVWPDCLAYFNALAGGPRQAYRHLVDSSLDWGQDLPGLKRWLEDNGLGDPGRTPVYLSYFGTGSPEYYGIRAKRLPRYLDFVAPGPIRPLTGGVYCISATMLQSVYSGCPGGWSRPCESAYQEGLSRFRRLGRDKDFEELRFGRLCAFLRRREPDDEAGYSILIYRLSDEDVSKALYGPPTGI